MFASVPILNGMDKIDHNLTTMKHKKLQNINNNIMAYRLDGTKPLSETMLGYS